MVRMRCLLVLLPAVLLAGPPRYARVGDFEGQVEIQTGAPAAWTAAERNAPLSESARIRAGASSRIEIEFDEGSVLRLGANRVAEVADYARLSTGARLT